MKNAGTLITSPIRPLSSSMSIPTAFANELLGGFQTVNSTTDMNNIPVQRRVFGMLVYVTGSDQFFQLKQVSSPNVGDNLNWALPNFDIISSDWINSVISATGTPPISPSTGDRYLVTSGTGVWLGYNNLVVEWNGTIWAPTVPSNGMTVRLESDPGPVYGYLNGAYPSGTWVKENFVGSGTYTQVAYFDGNGNITGDSGFTRDLVNLTTFIGVTGPDNNGGFVKSIVIIGATTNGGDFKNGAYLLHSDLETDAEIACVGASSDFLGNGSVDLVASNANTSTASSISVKIDSVKFGPFDGTSPYFTLPKIDGYSGQSMITDGFGNLTFGTPSFATPSQGYVDYVIATGSVVTVPDYQEYLVYGDLDVNGTLDIGSYGKVVIINGGLSTGASSSIVNLGNIEMYDFLTNAQISGPVNYIPVYGSVGLTYSNVYYSNGSLVMGTPSTFLSISDSGTISFGTISTSATSSNFLMLDANNNVVSEVVYVNQYKTFGIQPSTFSTSGSASGLYSGGTVVSGSWIVIADTFHDTNDVQILDSSTFSVVKGIYNIYLDVNYTSGSQFGGNAPFWIQTHLKFLSGPDTGDFACICRGVYLYGDESVAHGQGSQIGFNITSDSTFNVIIYNPSGQTFNNSFGDINLIFERIG